MLVVAIIATIILGKRVSLVADEDIRLTADPAGTTYVGVVRSGEEVPVIECADLKHYIVPKVRVGSLEGYVIVGRFRMKRMPAWTNASIPLSFSCG
jgi:hypothetical protein